MPKVSEEHRAARREQILRAAIVCVAEDGFHRTTMADVITQSGLSAGAVYGYFKGKNDIISALAEYALGLVSEALDARLADGQLPSIPELVGHLARTVETQVASSGVDLTRVIVAAWAEAVRDEQVRQTAAPKIAGLRARIGDLLARLQDEGRWDPGADPQHVAKAVVGLIPGFILQRLILRDVEPEIYESAVSGLLAGQREPSGQQA